MTIDIKVARQAAERWEARRPDRESPQHKNFNQNRTTWPGSRTTS
jgi:hypothetical protein